MSDPVLHVITGPDGAGKATYHEMILGPSTGLALVDSDQIADREQHLSERRSFATHTVFAHASKARLVKRAADAGYLVILHIIMVPEDLAVARVQDRVANGGRGVPEAKIRERYQQLWDHVRPAVAATSLAHVYDNSSAADPFRIVATFRAGRMEGAPQWPAWTPAALHAAVPNLGD